MDVYKFGGSSLASADGFKKVLKIVKKKRNCVIVLSAIGKRSGDVQKITDLLIELCKNRNNSTIALGIVSEIKKRFFNIAKSLNVSRFFYIQLINFLINYPKYDDNFIIASGEYFTCLLFSLYSKIPFIDSAELIKFERTGKISVDKTSKKINAVGYTKYITSGFYGSDDYGEITLFPRGGGDVTGAIFASILRSKTYYNYTNVDGIYNIPPDCKCAKKTVSHMNFTAMYKLSKRGMQAYSCDAIGYICAIKAKLIIANTYNPDGNVTTVNNRSFSDVTILSHRQNNVFQVIFKKTELQQKTHIIYAIIDKIMSGKIHICNYKVTNKNVVIFVDSLPNNDLSYLKNNYSFLSIEKVLLITFINSNGFSDYPLLCSQFKTNNEPLIQFSTTKKTV